MAFCASLSSQVDPFHVLYMCYELSQVSNTTESVEDSCQVNDSEDLSKRCETVDGSKLCGGVLDNVMANHSEQMLTDVSLAVWLYYVHQYAEVRRYILSR